MSTTTIHITIKKVENGHCIKIHHEGDQLDFDAFSETSFSFLDYCNAAFIHADFKEDQSVMKQGHKELENYIKNQAGKIEMYKTNGVFREKPEEGVTSFATRWFPRCCTDSESKS